MARKQGSTTDNVSHLFAELDPDQPANAIVNFVSKMIGSQKRWALTASRGFYFLLLSIQTFFPLLFFDLFVNECKRMKETEHVRCISVLLQKHVRAFLCGRTPEWIRGSAEWGRGYVWQRDGRPFLWSPCRVTQGWDEEMARSGLIVWFLSFFLRKC